MADRAFRTLAILCIFSLLLSACGHVISSEMRQKAQRGLSIQEVQKNPDAHIGKTVIWGGVIMELLDGRDGTVLKVAETPLDSQERPKDASYSRGKFLARAKYLDPEVYEKRRKITLAGEIIGKEVEPSGGFQYAWPVLSIKEVHLWRSYEYQISKPQGWDVYPDYFYNWGR
jgi:outer membrane lipoprotein